MLSDIPHQNYFDVEFETQIKAFLDNCDTTDYDKCIKDTDICDILNENVKIEEIEYAVRKLKVGKSPGIDWIPVEFIKESIDIIKYDLLHLFNHVLSCEKYPDEWGQGLLVGIPKGSNDIRPRHSTYYNWPYFSKNILNNFR